MAHTSDRLLQGLRRRGVVPASQALLADSDILQMADDITESMIVPMISSLREEYFIVKADTTVVVNRSEYAIPYRAIGRALREVKLKDSVSPTSKRRLTRINPGDEHLFLASATPQGFYCIGDQIALVPPPSASDLLLELWYPMKPSRLCALSSACVVTSVNAGDVTCANVPDTFTAGVLADFVAGKQGNSCLGIDAAITGVSGSTISFASTDVPTTLVAGDYVSLAQTSPVIQVPDEVYSLLESHLAQRVLKTLGDLEGANALTDDIAREDKNARILMEPRVQGEPQKIINRSGLLRGQRTRARFGWLWR